MAGDLYRAMQRTGGLQPVVDMMKQIQAERDKQKFLNNLFDSYNKARGNIRGLGEMETGSQSPMGMVQEPNVNPLQPKNQGFLNQVLSNAQSNEGANDYNQAQNILSDFVVGNLRNSDNDPQKLNALTKLLAGEVEGLKPEDVGYETINPTMDIYKKTGNNLELWKKGETTPKTRESNNKYFGDGSSWIEGKDGNMIFRPGPDKGKEDEQGNPPKIADDLGELTTLVDRYNNIDGLYDNPADESGSTYAYVDKDGEEQEVPKEWIENQKKSIFSEVKGKTAAITRKIDEQVPGFEKSLNKFFDALTPIKERLSKEEGSRKDKREKIRDVINKTVDSATIEGKPIPTEIRNWYKEILNSRLF